MAYATRCALERIAPEELLLHHDQFIIDIRAALRYVKWRGFMDFLTGSGCIKLSGMARGKLVTRFRLR
jgi:hypothetical protein